MHVENQELDLMKDLFCSIKYVVLFTTAEAVVTL